MSGFNINESVVVVMARNDIFDFQTSPRIKAVVLYYPCDVGDCWIFRHRPSWQLEGTKFSVNPLSPDFVGIEADPQTPEPSHD